MNKKKLLFLTVHFDTGGTEKVTFDIITHLDPKKYDITLMSMYGGGYFWDRLPEYVHKKYFFPKFRRFVIRYVTMFPAKMVYRTFIKDKYDVEIACGDDIPSRVIGHSPNRDSFKISWIHMDVSAHGYQGHEMRTASGRERFYRGFDKIVNVSQESEKKFKQKFGDEIPMCVIYNPVDSDAIRKRSCDTPAFRLDKNVFNILCMGRFMPEKGYERMIHACAKVKSEGVRPFQVTVLGEGHLRPVYERLTDEFSLTNEILFPGYVNNPYPIIRQADLFLMSSTDESFSLAVAEAMTLGVPVLSTRCTGPVELLRDGEAGMLVENSTEGITDGLRRVLTDPDKYAALKAKAAANTENFDIQKQMKEIEDLLDSGKTGNPM